MFTLFSSLIPGSNYLLVHYSSMFENYFNFYNHDVTNQHLWIKKSFKNFRYIRISTQSARNL